MSWRRMKQIWSPLQPAASQRHLGLHQTDIHLGCCGEGEAFQSSGWMRNSNISTKNGLMICGKRKSVEERKCQTHWACLSLQLCSLTMVRYYTYMSYTVPGTVLQKPSKFNYYRRKKKILFHGLPTPAMITLGKFPEKLSRWFLPCHTPSLFSFQLWSGSQCHFFPLELPCIWQTSHCVNSFSLYIWMNCLVS